LSFRLFSLFIFSTVKCRSTKIFPKHKINKKGDNISTYKCHII